MINYIDWQTIDYGLALEKQTAIFDSKVKAKLNSEVVSNDFIVCQHTNVYTLGLHGKENNMLVSQRFLQTIGAKLYHINRGGDITYHGPGQIVGYPSLNLDSFDLGIRDYIFLLEQTIINVCAQYNIICQRLEGATGVWLYDDNKPTRKICAIGVKVSRGITMHGFAFNVNTDLKYFTYINPCGFIDKGATSMQKELGKLIDIEKVKIQVYEEFKKLLYNE